MKPSELERMISLIDDEKLAASEQTGQKGLPPVWQKTLAAAAVLVAVLATGLLALPHWLNQLAPSETTTSQQTTTTIDSTTPETTVQGTHPIPRWEDQAIHEKFTGDAVIKGVSYQSAVQAMKSALVSEKLGDFTLTGYDYYAEKQHAIDASWYALDGIDPDCVVAVQYDGYEGFYSFYNADYSFLSLGDLIEKLDLENHLVINNSFQHTVWLDEDRENNWFRWDFYHLPDASIVWDRLLSKRDAPNSSDASNEELGWETMSISIDYPPAGQSNIGIVLYDNGYLATNILGTFKDFAIGIDRIESFVATVTESGTIYETMGGDSGVPFETTTATTAISGGDEPVSHESTEERITEAQPPVAETESTTPATTVPVSG